MSNKVLNISVGDLVRLVDDTSESSGHGLVLDVRANSDDLYVIFEQNEYQAGHKPHKDDEVFSKEPMVKILWAGSKRPLWFYFTEIVVVQST